MSITVADCMRLAALREASVVAGQGGLNKAVSSVTVLEYADTSALEAQLFLGNEMIISALVTVKDDIEAQCSVIRRLHEMGEVCLVLYYVGIFVLRVDERLIETADALNFPLIVMPPNRYNLRYSEVITEVLSAIINDQKQETDIVGNMLDRISQLKEEHRNIGVVMRILSDRLRCSLLLTDRGGDNIAFAAWPMAAYWGESDFAGLIAMRHEQALFSRSISHDICGRQALLSGVPFDTERRKGLFLLGIDETGIVTAHYLRQAAEVIQLFANIWNDNFAMEGPDALLRAILSNQPVEMRRIAKHLNIHVEYLNTMWILLDRSEKVSKRNRRQMGEKAAAHLMRLLGEHHKTFLVDVFESYVVAFMDSPIHDEQERELCDYYMEQVSAVDPDIILVRCTNLMTTESVRNAYVLMEQNIDMATVIYPTLKVIGLHELQFADKCRLISEKGEADVQRCLSILQPLFMEESGQDLIETLSCFFLDMHASTQRTADHLFIHKNTVKYRIRRAKECLGIDVTKMPEMMDMYVALALNRLLSQPKT